jgi:hypothetical protein
MFFYRHCDGMPGIDDGMPPLDRARYRAALRELLKPAAAPRRK